MEVSGLQRGLLSLAGLAEYLSLSEDQARTLVNTGDFPQPIEVLPGIMRWSRQSIDEAIDHLATGSHAGGLMAAARRRKTTGSVEFEPGAVTPSQLAKRWQVSQRHIYNLVQRGAVQALPYSSPLRISVKEVERIESRQPMPQATAEAPTPEKTKAPTRMVQLPSGRRITVSAEKFAKMMGRP